jgi:cysteine sulfinate desulfinase/cysteine desulfurase-like protein
LEKRDGFYFLQSDAETGGVDVDAIVSLVDDETALLSVMYASNISGAKLDIATIVERARAKKPGLFIITMRSSMRRMRSSTCRKHLSTASTSRHTSSLDVEGRASRGCRNVSQSCRITGSTLKRRASGSLVVLRRRNSLW